MSAEQHTLSEKDITALRADQKDWLDWRWEAVLDLAQRYLQEAGRNDIRDLLDERYKLRKERDALIEKLSADIEQERDNLKDKIARGSRLIEANLDLKRQNSELKGEIETWVRRAVERERWLDETEKHNDELRAALEKADDGLNFLHLYDRAASHPKGDEMTPEKRAQRVAFLLGGFDPELVERVRAQVYDEITEARRKAYERAANVVMIYCPVYPQTRCGEKAEKRCRQIASALRRLAEEDK